MLAVTSWTLGVLGASGGSKDKGKRHVDSVIL